MNVQINVNALSKYSWMPFNILAFINARLSCFRILTKSKSSSFSDVVDLTRNDSIFVSV